MAEVDWRDIVFRQAPQSGEATAGLARVRPEGVDLSHGVALYLDDISVSFDGFRALDRLSLAIDAGELRCVIGPNGAGKTRPDSGQAWFGQTIDLLRLREADVVAAGIGRKFQKPTVFENLEVRHNLELAMKARKRVRDALRARPDARQLERMHEVLRTIGLLELARRLAGELSHGQKQWLEIGMLLMLEPQLLLLDEPVAGMTDAETERTAELLLSLAGTHTLMVVEHDMEFVRAIAQRVTVLHEGRVLAEGSLQQVQADERVIEVYLGR